MEHGKHADGLRKNATRIGGQGLQGTIFSFTSSPLVPAKLIEIRKLKVFLLLGLAVVLKVGCLSKTSTETSLRTGKKQRKKKPIIKSETTLNRNQIINQS